jgi:hypothetical protein
MNKRLKKVIPFLLILIALGVLALALRLLTKDPAHIPESQAQSIASAKAEKLCDELSTKEDVNCATLKLTKSDTSTAGIADTARYYFSFSFSAESKDQKKQWSFTVNQTTDGEVESSRAELSSQLVQ